MLVFMASAAPTDGRYTGTIVCDAMPPSTPQLRTTFSLDLRSGRVAYEREILRPNVGRTGTMERGNGTVTDAGDITVKGGAQDSQFTLSAEYHGRIAGDRITLEGTQQWQYAQGDIRSRSCQIALAR